ncbi:MAG: hypothetical protein R6V72_03865 [Cyclobacterium sp.]|uniref:hypothetical protein n=1 Tax=Cyclobacterium sp. TaxID=1966343 RepID=UPI0039711138
MLDSALVVKGAFDSAQAPEATINTSTHPQIIPLRPSRLSVPSVTKNFSTHMVDLPPPPVIGGGPGGGPRPARALAESRLHR